MSAAARTLCAYGVVLYEAVPAWPRGTYDLQVLSFGAVGAEAVEQALEQAVEAAQRAADRSRRRVTYYVCDFCPCIRQPRRRGRCPLCGDAFRNELVGGRAAPRASGEGVAP